MQERILTILKQVNQTPHHIIDEPYPWTKESIVMQLGGYLTLLPVPVSEMNTLVTIN